MEHDTPSHHYTPTYQISLIYLNRLNNYDSDTITLKKYQLFDLKVKGQGQNVVMMAHDTPSHDCTPAYQISLAYLKRKKVMFRRDSKFANPFRFKNELTPFFSIFFYKFTSIFFIWTVTHQFFYFIF